jgi:hypothetical protein
MSECLANALASGLLSAAQQGWLGRGIIWRKPPAPPPPDPVDPFGKTQVDPLGKTQVDPLGKTQVDPLGKTQVDPNTPGNPAGPGRTQDLGKTQPDLGKTMADPLGQTGLHEQPGARTDVDSPGPRNSGDRPEPPNGPRTREELEQALAEKGPEMRDADADAREAVEKFVDYRVNKPNPGRNWPGDPAKWDPAVDEALLQDMNQKLDRSEHTTGEFVEMYGRWKGLVKGQGGGSAPPPNPAPGNCPPNCGGPSGQSKSVAGAAGIENVLGGGRQ